MRRQACNPGLLAAAAALAAPGVCRAQPVQEEGPVIIGEREQRLRWFILDDFSASLDFYARYDRNSIDSEGLGTREDEELLFRESVGIDSRFFLGHPNLVDVTAQASLGIEDNFIDSETEGLENEHETSLFNEFNINALVLGAGPAPVTLFARRNESLLDRAFIGSVDSRTTEFGGFVRTFLDTAPTTIGYTHRIEEQDDALGLNDDTLTQDTFTVQTIWSPNDRHSLSFDYTLDFVDEARANAFDTSFTRHDATLIHEYKFGADERHNLRSSLRLLDQSGDFEQRTARLFETLTLRHTDTFETRYDLTLEDRDIRGQSQNNYRGLVTARHELFDSLVTTATAGASRFELSDENFTSDEYRAGVDWEYTKRVPLGRFDATLGLNYAMQEDSSRGEEIQFLDAPRTFPPAAPILLTGANILPNSVVVTDSSGVRRYVDGLDYRQRDFADRIEISRIVGGNITDGETVLIDYTLGPEPAATIDTFAFNIGTRYTIDEGPLTGLSPYAEYRDVSQEISPSSPTRIPFDIRSFRGGADYRVGRFTFNGEYENQDSSISPFDAYRASARYDHRLGINAFFRADLSHETIDFQDDGSKIDLDRALVEYGYQFASGLQIRLRALYRYEQDSLAGDTEGFEQSVELDWQIRQTRIFASLRNAMLESENETSDSQTLIFGLRREF